MGRVHKFHDWKTCWKQNHHLTIRCLAAKTWCPVRYTPINFRIIFLNILMLNLPPINILSKFYHYIFYPRQWLAWTLEDKSANKIVTATTFARLSKFLIKRIIKHWRKTFIIKLFTSYCYRNSMPVFWILTTTIPQITISPIFYRNADY